eukprot:5573001-Alexandrium_andersonii.AAC.1
MASDALSSRRLVRGAQSVSRVGGRSAASGVEWQLAMLDVITRTAAIPVDGHHDIRACRTA